MTFLCVVTWLVGAFVLNHGTASLELKKVPGVDREYVERTNAIVASSFRVRQWGCCTAGTALIVASMLLAARNAGLL